MRKVIDGKQFNDIRDVWLFKYDGDVDLKHATTDEVRQVKWLTPEEIHDLYRTGKMVSTLTLCFEKVLQYNGDLV